MRLPKSFFKMAALSAGGALVIIPLFFWAYWNSRSTISLYSSILIILFSIILLYLIRIHKVTIVKIFFGLLISVFFFRIEWYWYFFIVLDIPKDFDYVQLILYISSLTALIVCCFFMLMASICSNRFGMRMIQALICLFVLLPLIAYCSVDLTNFLVFIHYESSNMSASSTFWYNNDVVMHVIYSFALKSIFVLICFYFMFPAFQFNINKKDKSALLVMLITLIFLLTTTYIQKRPFRRYYNIKITNKNNILKYFIKNRKNPEYKKLKKLSKKIKDSSSDGNYFLIVGESHNYIPYLSLSQKYNMFFSKIQKDPDYIIFPAVYAPENPRRFGFNGESDLSFYHMFTNAKKTESYRNIGLPCRITLYDITGKCGYNRVWCSICRYKAFIQISNAISQTADYRILLDNEYFNGKYINKGMQIDSEMPGVLDKIHKKNMSKHQRNFVVIKLLGLHTGDLQVPERFTTAPYQKLNNYEQANLYVDENLEKLISKLKSYPKTKAIIYCSDHSNERTDKHKITMFVYLAKSLQKEQPGLKEKIKEQAQKDFWIFNIYDLVLNIMNISVNI